MGKLGTRWNINGVPAAFITRGNADGRYRVTFERDTASLEAIETIDWAKPIIQPEHGCEGEFTLPEGYGFEVEDLQYQHTTRCFVAELKIAKQYLGDVTRYQAEVEALNQLVAAKDITLQEQAAAIQAQQSAAADLTNSLQAAYEEGVESNG